MPNGNGGDGQESGARNVTRHLSGGGGGKVEGAKQSRRRENHLQARPLGLVRQCVNGCFAL